MRTRINSTRKFKTRRLASSSKRKTTETLFFDVPNLQTFADAVNWYRRERDAAFDEMGARRSAPNANIGDHIVLHRIQRYHKDEREMMMMMTGDLQYMKRSILDYLEKIKDFCKKNKPK
jgi:hypothetical protein